jgi:hypothetical protein
MEQKYLKDPYLLKDKGYECIEEPSTDEVRSIWFYKKIYSSEYTFVFRIRYTLYLSDAPFASYAENHQYDFEEISMAVEIDNSLEDIDYDDLRYNKLSVFNLRTLESFIEKF